MAHQVTCINKRDHYSPYERIERIGGATGSESGGPWTLLLDDAIQGVESGKWSFFVMARGVRTNVIVATNNGRKYLKTEADGLEPNNLLALPECPRR